MNTVFIFAGEFKDRAEACLYSEPQWEPEPDSSASNEEYEAWENRNPVHRLQENIDAYLDSDFIETVDLNYAYLSSLRVSSEDIDKIKARVKPHFNYFILVFKDALDASNPGIEPVSNRVLEYCGQYECLL